jgi:hypothetical protein
MSKTAIQTSLNPGAIAPPLPPPKARKAGPGHRAWQALSVLASLRLTVVLFALSIVLVFVGTLAQIDAGIWTVVKDYFRSFYVWVPLQLFFPRSLHIPGSFPFPGGWLLGSLLLANLLAAHATRFKVSWKRSGILLLHAGIIVMLVSELVTGLFAVEGNMTIVAGGEANYVEHNHASELAVIDPSDPKKDDVVVIPGSILRKGGMIRHESLPFDVQVDRYLVNSAEPEEVGKDFNNPATAGHGRSLVALELPENSGTGTDQKVDIPSAYLTLKEKGTERSLGTFLVSVWFPVANQPPQQVIVGGKSYEVGLRFKRTYKPYTIRLLEFRHDKYIGTDTPKNFSSRVRVMDPERGEDREVLISMNNPLRFRGETFYQTGWIPGDRGTILQVVRNPGWLMPYVSCIMVALGMLVHFGLQLFGSLSRRIAP